jgi:hypothetical protein
MSVPIQEGAGNIPQQAFERWLDPKGTPLVSINRDGTIFCQGVGFVQGGALIVGPVPVIQASYDEFNSTAQVSLTETQALATMYQITFYYGPAGVTGSGSWSPVVAWTDPNGNAQTLEYPFLGYATAGDVPNIQSYSIPFACKANTSITVTGVYTGTAFPMNVSLRIVAMP